MFVFCCCCLNQTKKILNFILETKMTLFYTDKQEKNRRKKNITNNNKICWCRISAVKFRIFFFRLEFLRKWKKERKKMTIIIFFLVCSNTRILYVFMMEIIYLNEKFKYIKIPKASFSTKMTGRSHWRKKERKFKIQTIFLLLLLLSLHSFFLSIKFFLWFDIKDDDVCKMWNYFAIQNLFFSISFRHCLKMDLHLSFTNQPKNNKHKHTTAMWMFWWTKNI